MGLAGDAVPSIEAMADADAALIADVARSQAYRLAGFCNGGVIAFEVARRLEAAGARVDVLALLASSAPNARLEALWALCGANERRFRLARRVVNRLRGRSIVAQLPAIARGLTQPAGTAARAYAGPDYRLYEDRLLRYFPRPYARTIDLIWADDDDPVVPSDPTMGWRHVTRVRRHAMHGNHITMLTDHVAELGRVLHEIVAAADASDA
jgi:surfactin synthase thioesterase subunit